ncbi:hypothetical protein [Fictibacillus phosphorivorans]|nr:hypothetical protein [Fictibacillus phosphorivorans]
MSKVAMNPKVWSLNPQVLAFNPQVLAIYPRVDTPRHFSTSPAC